jgi:hypothetical protein
MNNLDYYRAVLFGAVVAAFFLSMFYVFTREDKPQKPQSNFEVVDTYKGCEIVRYTNPNLANYQYFLDCRK